MVRLSQITKLLFLACSFWAIGASVASAEEAIWFESVSYRG
jgi:hypothetical protein